MGDRHVNCSVCQRRIATKIYRMHPGTALWNIIVMENPNRGPFQENSPICRLCYDNYRKKANQPPPQQHAPDENLEYVNAIGAYQDKCCVCLGPGRCRITPLMRAQCWQHHRIFVPENNRYCDHHRNELGLFNEESLNNIANKATATGLDPRRLAKYLETCLSASFEHPNTHNETRPRIDVLNSDSDCYCYTGLHLEAFKEFCDLINIPHMKPETKVKALALLLCKLRMGNSQDQLGHFFGLSQAMVAEYIDRASEAVDAQFVPQFLGFHHITREDYVQNHMNTMTRILHNMAPNAASALLDGTYFEVEKSNNYGVQKLTYSMQKHYNLVKFMFVVAPDGYILHCFGPTGSDMAHNDAAILNQMIPDEDGLRTFFQPGDLFIVDRGFRDSQAGCEQLGIRVHMPAFLNGRSQLTRKEADMSRIVTKVRWTIESVNGRIKKVFSMLRNQIPNLYINKLGRFVRICCALLNAYFRPIFPDKPEQLEIAQYIMTRSQMQSDFHEQIIAFGLDQFPGQWVLTNVNNIIDFPLLSEQDLRDITVGIYQIHNANSYTSYHLEKHSSAPQDLENYRLYNHREFDGVILARIPSRHLQTKMYNSIIAYTPGNHGPYGIVGYRCSCHIGLRMVGMCSHVASILWLLSYAIPNDAYRIPAQNIAHDLLNLRL